MGNCISLAKRVRFKKIKLTWPPWETKGEPYIPRSLRKFFPQDMVEEGRHAAFLPVFSQINFSKLPGYLNLLRDQAQGSQASNAPDEASRTAAPTIRTPALFGSMHVGFVVTFPDGLRWLLKIPANGSRDHFSTLEAEALTSEVLTMRLLKRETKIPLPEVYAFDNSSENPINSPFILMEFVNGTPLTDVWYDDSIPLDIREKRRETILRELVPIMLQLNKFTAPQGGTPLFDEQQNLRGVGSYKEPDCTAMWMRLDIAAVFHETGPFPNLQSYLRSVLRTMGPAPVDSYRSILDLFLQWIPDSAGNDPNDQSFVLTHTDLDLQNILGTPDGHITSLIDWDGTAFFPRAMGNERYPEWLIDDWNPLLYNYSSKPDPEACQRHADSPQDLSRYRAFYGKLVLDATSSSLPIGSSKSSQYLSSENTLDLSRTTALTHNSLLINTLKVAADQNYAADHIVVKIYEEILDMQTEGEFKTSRDLPDGDSRKLWFLADMLEAEKKEKEKDDDKGAQGGAGENNEEKEANQDQSGVDDAQNDKEEHSSEADGEDGEDSDEDSEYDEQEKFEKGLEWLKEGFQALFV